MVMATTKPISTPATCLADMTREEAETVTEQIKENFDSLGNMLIAARDRKAFRVLGYHSFETYCQTEFGKSSSTAYQAIEDAKVRSQLEARILENYGQEVTLKFPSSHLRPLKAVEGLDDKLKVIEYAQKLAAGEGKKATKQHLELAIFEISGKRSEDFRSAIQKLGFTQGTHVEILPPHRKERGIVRKIDKLGKIHVELFYGGIERIQYNATQLRILTNEEKPANPLEGSIAKKGDRVLIYAEGLKGRQGTIYTWNESKQALVMVDGETSPNLIAYAEMERIKPEQKDTNWEADLSWNTTKQTYYYFQKEDLIYSNKWPAGLTLNPFSHESSPIDFMVNWEDKFAGELLEGLATPTNLKTLVLAQAIELPEVEGKEFVGDLIDSLLQLFPQTVAEFPSVLTQLIDENQRLQEQLAEAETAIQSMITASTPSALEPEQTADFLVEDEASTASTLEPEQTADFLVEDEASTASTLEPEKTSWFEVLDSNGFTQGYIQLEQLAKEPTESYRGWNIYTYDSSVADISHPIKGIFSIDFSWALEKEIIKPLEWLRNIINQVEDFCPGQLSLFPQPEATITTEKSNQNDNAIIAAKRERIEKDLRTLTQKLSQTKDEKKTKKIRANIRIEESRLKDIDNFVSYRIGDSVIRNIYPDKKGIVNKLEVSITGFLTVWVIWAQKNEGEPNLPEEHSVGTLTKINNVDGGEK